MDVYGFVSRVLATAVLVAAVMFAVSRSQTPPESAPEPYREAVAVTAPLYSQVGDSGEFANILISTEGGVSLEQAYLLVNGKPQGDFAGGQLRLRVYDGDILAVDCRAYSRELTFQVEALSAPVDDSYLPREFSCREETAILGFVVIR